MKLKKGFTLRSIAGEQMIVGEALEHIDFNRIIALNPSAAYLWQALGNRTAFTPQDAAQLLTREYEVDADTALADAKALLKAWQQVGILED